MDLLVVGFFCRILLSRRATEVVAESVDWSNMSRVLSFAALSFAVLLLSLGGRYGANATASDDEASEGLATVHDVPPILNFGSLDGYYRVLAGEIGISRVR